jgi:hypothetical protein
MTEVTEDADPAALAREAAALRLQGRRQRARTPHRPSPGWRCGPPCAESTRVQ